MKEITMPPLKRGDRRPTVSELEARAEKIRHELFVAGGTTAVMAFMFIAAYFG